MYQCLHDQDRYDQIFCLQFDPAARPLPSPLRNVHMLDAITASTSEAIPHSSLSSSSYFSRCEDKFAAAISYLQNSVSDETRAKSVLFILSFHHLTLASYEQISNYVSTIGSLGIASICFDLSGASANLLSFPMCLHIARFSDVLVSVESKDPVRRGSDVIIGEMITVQRARNTNRVTEYSDFLVLQQSNSNKAASGPKFSGDASTPMEFVKPLQTTIVDPQSNTTESLMRMSDKNNSNSAAAMEVVRTPKVVVYDRSDPDFDEDEDYDEDGNLNDEDLDL